MFDIHLSDDTIGDAARGAVQSVVDARKGRTVDEILALPEIESDEHRALLSLLSRGIDVSFIAGPQWSMAISAHAAVTVLNHGNSEFSAPSFCSFAMSGADTQGRGGLHAHV